MRESEKAPLDFWVNIGNIVKSQRQIPPIKSLAHHQNVPLSFAQERLWFLTQLNSSSSVYNIISTFGLNYALDIPALEQSLCEIVKRHSILRTTFPLVKEKPVQTISPNNSLKLPILNLQNLPPDQRQLKIHQLVTTEENQPFNLTQEPAFRVKLLQLATEEYLLLITTHHIVFDGFSSHIFFQELKTLYTAFSAGKPSPLPKLPIQYADFAHWQRQWLSGESGQFLLDYWQQQMSGHMKTLQLPTDYPPTSAFNYQGGSHRLQLSQHLTKALKALSYSEGTTLFTILFAAFQTLLYCYTQQKDIILCSPIANRSRPELTKLIGYFNNLVAIRTNFYGNPTFRELLSRVRQVTLDAYKHQDFPFQKLAEFPNLARIPLSRGMFALQNYQHQSLELSGVEVTPFALRKERNQLAKVCIDKRQVDRDSTATKLKSAELPVSQETSNFDLSLTMYDTGVQLTGVLRYKTELFDSATITQMRSNFQTLLEIIVANPDIHLDELPSWQKSKVKTQPSNLTPHSSTEIEGNSIALEKIAASLTEHPLVETSIVLPQEDSSSDQYLVAYIVPTQEQVPTLEELRVFLRSNLPDLAMPSALVPVEAIPLTANGEVDRHALVALNQSRQKSAKTKVAPRTPVEKKLAEVWTQVLWLESEVGIYDNFFDLGGHSLLAVRLVAEIEKAFEKKLSLTALSQLSTIAKLARILEQEADTTPEARGSESSIEAGESQNQLAPDIYHQLLAYTAGWKGRRVTPNALIFGMNTNGSKQPLFFCLQGFRELSQLAKYLGEDQPVYGMRSGHLVMKYTEENIKALAAHYVREILTVDSEGPYLIGGNCQAGKIALEIARQLQRLGKTITLLCLMLEYFFLQKPYSGKILFLLARESPYNPYKRFQNPELGWRKFCSGGFSIDIHSGGYGENLSEPHIQNMVEKLRFQIEKAQAESAESVEPAEQTEPMLPERAYQVQLTAQPSLLASVGETLPISVKVKNISPVLWPETEKSGITLGNHWLNEDGKVIQWADGRVRLLQDLPSGSVVELSLSVTAPMKKGRYLLELDLVEEGITWFKDKGSSTTTMAVEVNDNQQAMKTQLPHVFLNLGNAQCEQGDFAGALPYFQKALAINLQQSLEIYINLGDTFSQCGRFSEAIAAYQEAIALESDNSQIYLKLGNAQLKKKEFSATVTSYQKAIEIDPDLFGVYLNLGNALSQLQQTEAAIVAYQKGIKLEPCNHLLYINLANAQRQQGDLETAITNYEKALEINPDMYIYRILASTQRQQGNLKSALANCEKVIQLEPYNLSNYLALKNILTLARQLENMKRYSDGEQQEFTEVEVLEVIRLKPSSESLVGFSIDSPKSQTKVNGNCLLLSGWVLGPKSPPLAIEIIGKDGQLIQTLAINQSRLDVAKVYPQAPKASHSGFQEEVEITALLPHNELRLEAVFGDSSCALKKIVNQSNLELQLQTIFENNQRIPIGLIRLQNLKPSVEVLQVIRLKPSSESLIGFSIDFPKSQTKVNGNCLLFSGWVLGPKSPPQTIEIISEDGQIIQTLAVNQSRLDVAKVYPQAPKASHSGFREEVEITALLPHRELRLQAWFENNQRIPIGLIRLGNLKPSDDEQQEFIEVLEVIRLKPSSESLVDFNIDSPKSQTKVNGNCLLLSGWVLGRKSPPLAIEIIDKEGQFIKTLAVNQSRLDIAKVYPQAPKASQSGFRKEVEITALLPHNEIRLQAWFKNNQRIPIGLIRLRKLKGDIQTAIAKNQRGNISQAAKCNDLQTKTLQLTNKAIFSSH